VQRLPLSRALARVNRGGVRQRQQIMAMSIPQRTYCSTRISVTRSISGRREVISHFLEVMWSLIIARAICQIRQKNYPVRQLQKQAPREVPKIQEVPVRSSTHSDGCNSEVHSKVPETRHADAPQTASAFDTPSSAYNIAIAEFDPSDIQCHHRLQFHKSTYAAQLTGTYHYNVPRSLPSPHQFIETVYLDTLSFKLLTAAHQLPQPEF
jgi:hypothetical protein